MIRVETDVLVIGSGASGLLAAWNAARGGARVCIAATGAGASSWLQGLNVPLGHADPRDSAEVLYQDIVRESHGLSDPTLARQTAHTVTEVFEELVALGVGFAQQDGRFRQRHAAGSTYPRCCYVPGVMWGPEAGRVLRRHLATVPNVTQMALTVVDLLVGPQGVCGAVGFAPHTHEPALVACRAVVLAAGGVGRVFAHSTYPRDVWGAAAAIAYRAGATLVDMELIQFEPLVASRPADIRGFVVPTTLFGDGAVLRDATDTRFLPEFRPAGEAGMSKEHLVVAMATVARDGRAEPDGSVWLDATSVPRPVLEGYPWLYPVLKKHGIDLASDRLAVLPAAHTCLGGVKVDGQRATGVPGLFAAGEASAGVHGAGRLAGGSATEVVVSGTVAGRAAAAYVQTAAAGYEQPTREAVGSTFDLSDDGGEVGPLTANGESHSTRSSGQATPPGDLVRRLRDTMSRSAGVWRNREGLVSGLSTLTELEAELALHNAPGVPLRPDSPWLRVRDMFLVGRVILAAALERAESRGAHQRTDHPQCDPSWTRHIEWSGGSPIPSGAADRGDGAEDLPDGLTKTMNPTANTKQTAMVVA